MYVQHLLKNIVHKIYTWHLCTNANTPNLWHDVSWFVYLPKKYLLFLFLLWLMCVMIQLASFLTPSDIMLGLLAAAAHDVDHPGVNQPFLIKTKHHLASLYQVRLLIELLT